MNSLRENIRKSALFVFRPVLAKKGLPETHARPAQCETLRV